MTFICVSGKGILLFCYGEGLRQAIMQLKTVLLAVNA